RQWPGSAVIGLADRKPDERGAEHAEEGLDRTGGPGNPGEGLHRNGAEIGAEEAEQPEIDRHERDEPGEAVGSVMRRPELDGADDDEYEHPGVGHAPGPEAFDDPRIDD